MSARGPGPVVVVMGVSGSGKSTVGRLLAERLKAPFTDADGFHPAANIARMSSGLPLDDADRAPWLDAVADWIARHPGGAVLACSALRRRYRDRLRAAGPDLFFVHLDAPREVAARRLAGRRGHFMPPGLLVSQFEALEPLAPDEAGAAVPAGGTAAQVADLAYRVYAAQQRPAR